jgi:ribosomal protein S19
VRPSFPKQKKEAEPGEKPEPVRTHSRNMTIVPEMISSIIEVYNGKNFNQVEIKVSREVLDKRSSVCMCG